jgi:hypothetical protein
MRGIALAAALALAGPAAAAGAEALRAAIEDIRAASLARDPARAERHFAGGLILVSQSGKVYGRDAAIADLASGAESWTIREQQIDSDGALARVVQVVERTRKGAEPGRFRVLQLWRANPEDRWELFAQATVRMAE